VWLKSDHQTSFKHHFFFQQRRDFVNFRFPNRVVRPATQALGNIPKADVRVPAFFEDRDEHFGAFSDFCFEIFGQLETLVDWTGETGNALCSPAEPEFEGVWATTTLEIINFEKKKF
jgi:hypothetical protein